MPGIDFDGANSKLEHTTAAVWAGGNWTVCAWAYADGQGEGSLGRILTVPEGGQTSLKHAGVANKLRYDHDFDTTNGVWTWDGTDGRWNAIALSYDGNAANDPVARVNFAAATNFTEATTPVGTEVSGSGYCVGNISGQTATWDGGIMHVQVFNRILTALETDNALFFPGSIRNGLTLWLPMWDTNWVNDFSDNHYNGTATSLANRDTASPWMSRWMGLSNYGVLSVASAAAAGQPTMRRWGGIPHLPVLTGRGGW